MQTSAGRAEYQCKRSLFYSDRIFCKRAFSSAREAASDTFDFVDPRSLASPLYSGADSAYSDASAEWRR